jgi:hypothetical protein
MSNARKNVRKLRDIVSVKDFGAVGDGVTDDTVAIQAALDSRPRVVVDLSGGRWGLSAPLQINNDYTTIIGNGNGILRPLSTSLTTLININETVSNTLQFRCFGVQFFGYTPDGFPLIGGNAIRASNGPMVDSEIVGCWFNLGASSGPAIYGQLIYSFIDRCLFELSGRGISLDVAARNRSSVVSISNCLFFDMFGYGIESLGSVDEPNRDITIENCHYRSDKVSSTLGFGRFENNVRFRLKDCLTFINNDSVAFEGRGAFITNTEGEIDGFRCYSGFTGDDTRFRWGLRFSGGQSKMRIANLDTTDVRQPINIDGPVDIVVEGGRLSNAYNDGVVFESNAAGDVVFQDLVVDKPRQRFINVTKTDFDGSIVVDGCTFRNAGYTNSSAVQGVLLRGDAAANAVVKNITFVNDDLDANMSTMIERTGSIVVQEHDNTLIGTGTLLTGTFAYPGRIKYGNGDPEGVVVGKVGDMYSRYDGSTGTTLYIKETGTGNTGWVAK